MNNLIGTPPPEINPPLSVVDRRPNDRPFYIDECCRDCNSVLIYDDLVRGKTHWDDICFDEFTCPKCKNGCHLDWPPEDIQTFKEIAESCNPDNCIPVTEEMWAKAEALLEGVELDD